MHVLRVFALSLAWTACAPPADPSDPDSPDLGDDWPTDEAPDTDDAQRPDADRDGADDLVDCDDADPAIRPGAPERCNGFDDDCDDLVDDEDSDAVGLVDRWDDLDGDLHGAGTPTRRCPEAGGVGSNDDCDDLDPSVHPSATEVCGGADEDCDGLVDADDPSVDVTTGDWYAPDLDGDGFGGSESTFACGEPGAGWSTVAGDCDDTVGAVFPGAVELCNGWDDDCDGAVDLADDGLDPAWVVHAWNDLDGDGFGDPLTGSTWCGATPADLVGNGADCDDADPTLAPDRPEVCNRRDDDCDTLVDDADPDLDPLARTTWWPDGDGDGWTAADGDPVEACFPPPGFGGSSGDCDDSDASVHPDQHDPPCDGRDRDCVPDPDPPDELWVPDDVATFAEAAAVVDPGAVICLGPGTHIAPSRYAHDVPGWVVGGGTTPDEVVVELPTRMEVLAGGLGNLTVTSAGRRIAGPAVYCVGGNGEGYVLRDVVFRDVTLAPVWPEVLLSDDYPGCGGLVMRDVTVSGINASVVAGWSAGTDVDGLLVEDVHASSSFDVVRLHRGHVRNITLRGITLEVTRSFAAVLSIAEAIGGGTDIRIEDVTLLGPEDPDDVGDAKVLSVTGSAGVSTLVERVDIRDVRFVGRRAELWSPDAVFRDHHHVGAIVDTTVRALLIAGVRWEGAVEQSPLVHLRQPGVHLENATLVGGRVDVGSGAVPVGAILELSEPNTRVTNVILHDHATTRGRSLRSAIRVDSSTDTVLRHSVISAPSAIVGTFGTQLAVSTTVPWFQSYNPVLPPTEWDLRVYPESPFEDAGDPDILEPDGTRSEPGAFGGSSGW